MPPSALDCLAEEFLAEVEPKFNTFTGSMGRLVGIPLSYHPPPVSTTASKDKQSDSSSNGQPSTATTSKAPARQTQGKLVLGLNANRTPQNTKENRKEPKQEVPKKDHKFLPFTGKKYSLWG